MFRRQRRFVGPEWNYFPQAGWHQHDERGGGSRFEAARKWSRSPFGWRPCRCGEGLSPPRSLRIPRTSWRITTWRWSFSRRARPQRRRTITDWPWVSTPTMPRRCSISRFSALRRAHKVKLSISTGELLLPIRRSADRAFQPRPAVDQDWQRRRGQCRGQSHDRDRPEPAIAPGNRPDDTGRTGNNSGIRPVDDTARRIGEPGSCSGRPAPSHDKMTDVTVLRLATARIPNGVSRGRSHGQCPHES